MYQLGATSNLLVAVFLIASMLSIGMQTRPVELSSLLLSGGFLARLLFVNFVAVPAVGVAIALLLPLEPPVAAAMVLMACTPGGLSAVNFTTKVKGSAYLAGAAMCLLSFLALVISPLLLQLALPGHVVLVIPYGEAFVFTLVFMLLPLLAGMLLLGMVPRIAAAFSTPLGLVALVIFVAFMVVNGAMRKTAVGEIGVVAVAAMLLFIGLSMLIGWFMGGPARETRQILATASSMRNPLLCLAILHASAPGHAALVPLLAFSLLMVPLNTLLTVYSTVLVKWRARNAT